MNVAIFPAGQSAQILAGLINDLRDIDVKCFVDNNPNKLGYELGETKRKIVSPYRLKDMMSNGLVDKVLVTSTLTVSYGLDEILRQLERMEIHDYQVIPAWLCRKKDINAGDIKSCMI